MLQFCHGWETAGVHTPISLTSPWSSVEHGRALICLTAATAEGTADWGRGFA